MGTPAYMAPEQIDGRALDGRADLYALGCTLYELLTGRKPFPGENAVDVMLQQTQAIAKPVVAVQPSVPEALSQVVEKLMAKSPDARYASAGDVAADLEKILAGGKPQIVVEIESIMDRMQELAETTGDSDGRWHPAAIVGRPVSDSSLWRPSRRSRRCRRSSRLPVTVKGASGLNPPRREEVGSYGARVGCAASRTNRRSRSRRRAGASPISSNGSGVCSAPTSRRRGSARSRGSSSSGRSSSGRWRRLRTGCARAATR